MSQLLNVIEVEKQFMNCNALNGVNMSIAEGQIVGLLGPNASGKTTLLKIIAGLQQPTTGNVMYRHKDVGLDEEVSSINGRSMVSFCPDVMKYPGWMKVKDAFKFYEDLYPDYKQERANELIKVLELESIMNARVSSLSKGMSERLTLALTFSRDTKLYMLDEPLDGIDPVGKMKVIDAILAFKPENASVLLSTHLVKDIERILDSVYFLSKGKIIFNGLCDEIREKEDKTVEQTYLEVFIREGTF